MYYVSVITIFIFSAFLLPIGVIANDGDDLGLSGQYYSEGVVYEHAKSRTYQIEGHSMAHLGFDHESYVSVVPASGFKVGDVIAFECSHSKCDGAYIKKITRKNGACYWVEGRKDYWYEDGKKKESMDSRTTYGWLCNDKIDIFGVAFAKSV